MNLLTKKPQILILAGLLTAALGFINCHKSPTANTSEDHENTQNMNVTVATMRQVLDAFNRHDLDAIMEHFSEDCSFDFPKGPEPFGQRFHGKAQVREALAGRFKGIPDVHYGDDRHWISADIDQGVSEWTLTGTTTTGIYVEVRGCDLWEFRDGKITRKDSYWKIVEPVI